VCIFCGHADHLDEFCFRRKSIEKRCLDYARNSYRNEFIDFPPRSYSHVLPHSFARVNISWHASKGDSKTSFSNQVLHLVNPHDKFSAFVCIQVFGSQVFTN
jgi:hypothetical protein